MPSREDQFILEMLACNMAKLGSDQKRKEVDSEVLGQGNVQTIKSDKVSFKGAKIKSGVAKKSNHDKDMHEANSLSNSTSEGLAQAIVFNHLREVSSELAAEFAGSHEFPLSSVKLQDCVELYCHKKLNHTDTNPESLAQAIVYNHLKEVSPELAAEFAGIHEIPKSSVRLQDVIKLYYRKKLNVPKVDIKVIDLKAPSRQRLKDSKHNFTLLEDQIMIENLVIPRLQNMKLSKVVLGRTDCNDLARQWNISPKSLVNHWTSTLQVTLLQHYSGTLNLRVERMLANFVSENYTKFSEIHWADIASRVEFAGHTDRSLRNIYCMVLMKRARMKLGVQSCKVTLEQVTYFCEELYGEGGKGGRLGSSKKQRQKEVIAFFKDKVKEAGLVNFL